MPKGNEGAPHVILYYVASTQQGRLTVTLQTQNLRLSMHRKKQVEVKEANHSERSANVATCSQMFIAPNITVKE